jgi:hypothetical protein
MALAFTNADPDGRTDVAGSRRRWSGKVAFDSSYPTGGEAVTASNFGLNRLDVLHIAGATALGNLAVWDGTNSKIKVFCPVTGVEAADTLSLATDSVTVTAWGV